MAAFAGNLLVVLPILATTRGAGPADPFADFGELSYVVIALDVINTVVVLFFLWKIWFRERSAGAPRGPEPPGEEAPPGD